VVAGVLFASRAPALAPPQARPKQHVGG